VPIIAVPLLVGAIWHILFVEIRSSNKSNGLLYLTVILFGIALIMLLWGHQGSKVAMIEFDDEKVRTTSFYGLGVTRVLFIKDLAGYNTNIIRSRRGREYEQLYLYLESRRVVRLSQFHHVNYFEMKEAFIRLWVKKLRYL
jgi:hypothetical protein